jgi:uncharacterized protein (TIGR02996 family)
VSAPRVHFFVRITTDGGGEPPPILRFVDREITIGRRHDNHLVLPYAAVGELHARLSHRESYVLLQDEKSETGTFLDGGRVTSPSVVREGQLIKIGPYQLELLDSEPPSAIEKSFLDAIQSSPRDDDRRLVYGDWLEEQGRVEQAEFVRVQVAVKVLTPEEPRFHELSSRLFALAPEMPRGWRRAVARPALENCDIQFELACPKQWDALQPTASPKQRYCGACKRNVHYADTVFEAASLAVAGHCVAVDVAQRRSPNDLRPRPPPMPGMIAPPPLMAGAIAPPPLMTPPGPPRDRK